MNRSKKPLLILASLGVLAVCVLLSLALGSRPVGIADVLGALRDGARADFTALVVRERIPRTIFSLIAGASLGVSGLLMQAITRNPIADPSILGVNMGASLFVVAGIAFWGIGAMGEYILLALLGAALTAAFVYAIASMGAGGATPIKLALAGSATSAALSSLVSALVLPRTSVMNTFRFWQIGSVSGATWEAIAATLPFLAIGVVFGFLLAPALNAMALGDDVAVGLGVRTGLVRTLGALTGVVLCGAITALAGPIGFIGLMVPHAARLILGQDMRLTLPVSAIAGAALLTLADVAGRLLGRPGELEVGIVTAFLGGPILIYIAKKARMRAL